MSNEKYDKYLISYKHNHPFSTGSSTKVGTKEAIEDFIKDHPSYTYYGVYKYISNVETTATIDWEDNV